LNPQTLARLTGVLFLITYVTSIPAFFVFYAPVLNDPGYITGVGPDTGVLVGAFLEVLLIIANVGTALTLFVLNDFYLSIVTKGILLAIVFLSITLITGIGGQLSLCQATFCAVGAFATAQITARKWVRCVLVERMTALA
jgi:hypothetical protein